MTVPGAKHNLEAGQEEESATSQQIRRYRHNRKNGGNGQKFAGLYTGPYFDPSMPNNVSVQLGDTALLICKVNQVGGKTVSTYLLYLLMQWQFFLRSGVRTLVLSGFPPKTKLPIGRLAKLASQKRPGFLAGNSLNSCPDFDLRTN